MKYDCYKHGISGAFEIDLNDPYETKEDTNNVSIDDMIARARACASNERNNQKLNNTLGDASPYYSQDCAKLAEENDQLADWLEELKAYRANAAERKEVKIWNRRENDKIDSQSTTYDVDKVVEELKEIICPKRLYFCRVSKGGCNKSDDVGCIDCAIQKAIEIVKRGGKNE